MIYISNKVNNEIILFIINILKKYIYKFYKIFKINYSNKKIKLKYFKVFKKIENE